METKGRMKQQMKWKVAQFLDRFDKYCWADLAMFGIGYNSLSETLFEKGGDACRRESNNTKSGECWCGKYCKGERRISKHPQLKYKHQ